MKEGLTKKTEVKIGQLMDEVAKACWFSSKGKKVNLVVSENYKIILEGTIYEDYYESFTADTDVYIEVNGKKEPVRTICSHSVAPYKMQVEEKGSVEIVKKLFENIKEEYIDVVVVE